MRFGSTAISNRMLGLAVQNTLIWGFDTAVDVSSVGNLWITNSGFQNINTCVTARGFSFGVRINGLQCSRDKGDGLGPRGDAIVAVGVAYTGPAQTVGPEAIEIDNSDILDFNNGIRLDLGNVAKITSSTIQARSSGIRVKDWGKGLTIRDNYILTTDSAVQAGIFVEGTVVDAIVRANQIVSIVDNVLESTGSGTNNGIQINESGLFGAHNVNIMRNDFTGFTGRDIYVFGPNQITLEGNTARSSGAVASIELTSTTGGINFITRNKAAVSIVANASDLTSGLVRKCDNVVAGVREACSWAVTINDAQTLSNKTFVAPALGVATATSVNGVTIDNNSWTAYTPTITSEGGTLTGASIIKSGRYKQIGKTVVVQMEILISTLGSGSPTLGVRATLPVTAAGFRYTPSVFEYAITGKTGSGFINGLATPTLATFYDSVGGSFWVAGYGLSVTMTYEVP
jgi:hypothetical protein